MFESSSNRTYLTTVLHTSTQILFRRVLDTLRTISEIHATFSGHFALDTVAYLRVSWFRNIPNECASQTPPSVVQKCLKMEGDCHVETF